MFFIHLYHKLFPIMNAKSHFISFLTRMAICVCFFLFFTSINAQDTIVRSQKSEFWKKVRIGGGLGLGIGGGYTDITVAPSAIYEVNEYVAFGVGMQYSYVKQKNFYNSHIYGASLLGFFSPIPEVQLSVELEELRVNNSYDAVPNPISDDFWNTALFLGAGYRNQNVTVGIRYNVLYKESANVYSQAWMPFVRVYF